MNRLLLDGRFGGSEYPLIMIFTEGTVLGHKRIIDMFSHKKYHPIKNCVEKIKKWEEQGAHIVYLTSTRKMNSVKSIQNILLSHGFPGSFLYYRTRNDKYRDIAEALMPNILIEDNCKSIGGAWQMVITYVNQEIKNKIHSIVVEEFHGIDSLPDNLTDLMKYKMQ